MKTYEVELRRESYITVTVDAHNEDEAETLAWEYLETNIVDSKDSNWDVESVEEIFN